METLDKFDLAILNELQRDARLTNVKDLHTSFSLGEVKASGALPLGHLVRTAP